ncbi:MAG: hypothetical protein K0S78_4357 [Thermomicrobiales bacterium]|nr:hypothetical protein [Thermomicrobiales bacterium]
MRIVLDLLQFSGAFERDEPQIRAARLLLVGHGSRAEVTVPPPCGHHRHLAFLDHLVQVLQFVIHNELALHEGRQQALVYTTTTRASLPGPSFER